MFLIIVLELCAVIIKNVCIMFLMMVYGLVCIALSHIVYLVGTWCNVQLNVVFTIISEIKFTFAGAGIAKHGRKPACYGSRSLYRDSAAAGRRNHANRYGYCNVHRGRDGHDIHHILMPWIAVISQSYMICVLYYQMS